jgi:hypothetical protein
LGNMLPVTLGNLVGGFVFTGLFLYWTYPPASRSTASSRTHSTGGAGLIPVPEKVVS